MANYKTIIVIGAGVSKEVNMPLGNELTDLIARNFDVWYEDGFNLSRGSHVAAQAIKIIQKEQDPNNRNAAFNAVRLISEAIPLAESIDNFLNNHRENDVVVDCGKLGITISILEAERQSSLFFQAHQFSDFDVRVIAKCAYSKIFQKLAKGKTKEEFATTLGEVMFVNFNYDRCLEQMALIWTRKYFRLDERNAAELLGRLRVFRPYGSLGKLPWQHNFSGQQLVFGAQLDSHALLKVSKRIRTFTEGSLLTKDSKSELGQALHEARFRIFLGFAFHPMNMTLLECDIGPTKIDEYITLATAYGMSKNNIELIQRSLERTCPDGSISNSFVESDLTASKLFDEYSLMIEDALP